MTTISKKELADRLAAACEPPFDPVVIAEVLLDYVYGPLAYEPDDMENVTNDLGNAFKGVISGFVAGFISANRRLEDEEEEDDKPLM